MPGLAWIGFDAGPVLRGPTWPIDGGRGVVPASAESLVLTVFVWQPEAGDVVRVEIRRPDGTTTHSQTVQPRSRPRQTWHIDKTWEPSVRPTGLWTARVQWERGELKRELRTSTVLQ